MTETNFDILQSVRKDHPNFRWASEVARASRSDIIADAPFRHARFRFAGEDSWTVAIDGVVLPLRGPFRTLLALVVDERVELTGTMPDIPAHTCTGIDAAIVSNTVVVATATRLLRKLQFVDGTAMLRKLLSEHIWREAELTARLEQVRQENIALRIQATP